MPELDFQSFVSSCSIFKYHPMALVSITLPSFGQTEWMLSPTFVSSLSMDRGPFTKLMQPEASCQKVPPSVTIWKKHQAFMPGHKSFCISEPSLIKLLRDEGSPVCLIRIPNSWWGRLYLGAGGQGVGQWGMDEANLEEPFWSLWSANNDIIDDFPIMRGGVKGRVEFFQKCIRFVSLACPSGMDKATLRKQSDHWALPMMKDTKLPSMRMKTKI